MGYHPVAHGSSGILHSATWWLLQHLGLLLPIFLHVKPPGVVITRPVALQIHTPKCHNIKIQPTKIHSQQLEQTDFKAGLEKTLFF